MEIRGDGGKKITAELLQARLAHTVEQHLEENGKNQAVISDQQKQLNQQKQELEALQAQAQSNAGKSLLLPERLSPAEGERILNAALKDKDMAILDKHTLGLTPASTNDIRTALKYLSDHKDGIALSTNAGTFTENGPTVHMVESNNVKILFKSLGLSTDLMSDDPNVLSALAKILLELNNIPYEEKAVDDSSKKRIVVKETSATPDNANRGSNLEILQVSAPKHFGRLNYLEEPPEPHGMAKVISDIGDKVFPEGSQQRGALHSVLSTLYKPVDNTVARMALLAPTTGALFHMNSLINPPEVPTISPPAIQVIVKPETKIESNSSTPISRDELINIRDRDFQEVPVQSGDGYSQLIERHLGGDLKQLGITAQDARLAPVITLSLLLSNLNQDSPNLTLKDLTNQNYIGKIPEEVTSVFIPKLGVIPTLIEGNRGGV